MRRLSIGSWRLTLQSRSTVLLGGPLQVWYCVECAEAGDLSLTHEIPGHPYSRIFWEPLPQGQKQHVIRQVVEREGRRPDPPIRLAYGSFIERLQRQEHQGLSMQLPSLTETLSVKCRCGHNPQITPERLFQQAIRTTSPTLYLRS